MTQQPAAHSLITSDRVEGTPVFNRAGERIGHIANLSIDKISGQVVYALMSFGGFLGMGGRYHPLPWDILRYDTAQDGYVVPMDKAALKTAPSYSLDELEAFGGGDRTYPAEVMAYYGMGPYW